MTAPITHAPAAHAAPTPVTYDASQPVLPPRPTGRSDPAEPKASSWRSWPVLVIILAAVAIIVAVVLMVWPAHGDLDGKHSLAPLPAPERMQTEPEIKQPPPSAAQRVPAPPQAGATRDPWTEKADPLPPDPSASANDPDDTVDDSHDPGGLQDPFAAPHGPPPPAGRRHLSVNSRGMVWLAMIRHICRKLVQCGTDDATAQSTCDAVSHTQLTPPSNCPAADRCLQHIDTMSCGSQVDDLSHLSRLMTQFRDCADATQC